MELLLELRKILEQVTIAENSKDSKSLFQPPSSPSASLSEVEYHPLHGLRLSSTYKHSTGQIDYKFIIEDEYFYPTMNGYKVFAIDEHSVALIGHKDKYKVTFSPLNISL